MCDHGGNGDGVNNSGGWYEITENEVRDNVNVSDRTRSESM